MCSVSLESVGQIGWVGTGMVYCFFMCVLLINGNCVAAEELDQAGQKLEAKVYQTLQLQVACHLLNLVAYPE